MNKIILIAVAALLSFSSYAQKMMHGHSAHIQPTIKTVAKPTGIGDTLTLSNIAASDTVRVLYTHDAPGAGYTTGANSFNDKGFAERYGFSGADSSIKVIGVITQFGGSVNPASTKSITLKVWSQGARSMVNANMYYLGFPNNVLDSIVVPVTQLGIGVATDTQKQFMFATPTDFLSNDAFFVGYTFNYNYATLAGDTIALAASEDGSRMTPNYILRYKVDTAGDTTAVDTAVYVQNATLWSDNLWRDNYSQNDSLYNNLAIFPIVIIGTPSSVGSVTRNGFSLMGNYPNPANNITNIRFGLSAADDVTISISDMNGRTVYTDSRANLISGTHSVSVNTSGLPVGEYIYLVRTSAGAGMAAKMVVCR